VRRSLVHASLKLLSFFYFYCYFLFFKFFSTTVLYLRGTQLQLGLSWESMKFGLKKKLYIKKIKIKIKIK
jgi:hypothetical protein